MCVNEFYFCICFVKVNFQILEKFWKSEFPNIRKRVKISIYRHRLHRCKRTYQTILLSPVYNVMYKSQADYGINDFYPFINIFHLFQYSSNYYKISFFNFGKLCFRKKSSFVLFIVYNNICSLKTITRLSDTNDVNTTYVLHIPYEFQEFHFLLKFLFIHVQRAIKCNIVNSFVN